MSSRPKASTAFWTSWSGTPSLVRSPLKTAVSPWISPAACSATSPSRSLIRTCAPCSASTSAVARPIPRAEPVTIAAFPSSTPTCPLSLFEVEREMLWAVPGGGSAVRVGAVAVVRVRARRGRGGVPALDRVPQQVVQIVLRDLVDRRGVQALHRPAVARGVRVALVDVHGGRYRRVGVVVRRRRVEGVVERHAERVPEVHRVEADRDLGSADERREVVARLHNRAL